MEISKQGINYEDFKFNDETSQIGGDKTKTEKVNFADGLTKSEAEKIAKNYGNKDNIITEDEFVEACLSDDEDFKEIKKKGEAGIREIFQGYFKSFFKSQETKPEIKANKDKTYPESLTFGSPKVSLSDIKTGSKEGEYFDEIKMDNKTYKRTSVTKRLDGVEKYILEPDEKDGSKILVEREPNGTQRYTVYGTDKKKCASLELDNKCEAKSIFRYDKNGNAYEREYFNEDCIRTYEYDDNNNLVSSKDYSKNKDGSYDKDKPRSMQKYKYVEGLGSVWDSRVEYKYDDDDKQSIKSTGKYTYDVEDNKDSDTKKLTVTRKVYDGDSTKDKDLLTNEVKNYDGGILLSSEENVKDKKTTKFKVNPDGTSTTTITEGDKKTVIEKDKKGNITSKKVTENGITKTTTYKDGKEDKTTTDNFNKDGFSNDIQKVLSKINTDELPDEVKEAISTVSLAMLDGEETTENSKTEDRKKEEGENSNKYKKETTTEGGKEITYTNGVQEFKDRTNKYVETYEGKDENGKQTGGYGIINYENGDIEIHYDKFEDGKMSVGKSVVINKEDETITYYTTNEDGEEEKVTYDFDGNEIED